MKKILALILALCMIFTLVACGGDEDKSEDKKDSNKKENVAVIGDYTAEFLRAEFVKDYDGNDAIAIYINYTNNSSESQKFEWAFYYHVYQGDAELTYAPIFVSEDSYDMLDDTMDIEVEPGKSQEVIMTYGLKDKTTNIRVTFSDLFEEQTGEFNIDISEVKASATTSVTTPENSEAPTDAPETSESAEETGMNADWWLGDWYGTWMITDGDGDYADMAWTSWDCCAYINTTSNGNFFLSIWDEDYNDYDNNCLSETILTLSESYYGPYGSMTTTDDEGNYFYTSELDSSSWFIDPSVLEYRDTFVIFGEGVDSEGETYEYMITLCKWGCEWDENAGEYPTYYDTYFVPLMQEGAELPALFEPEN